jgi:hypothetical protein
MSKGFFETEDDMGTVPINSDPVPRIQVTVKFFSSHARRKEGYEA